MGAPREALMSATVRRVVAYASTVVEGVSMELPMTEEGQSDLRTSQVMNANASIARVSLHAWLRIVETKSHVWNTADVSFAVSAPSASHRTQRIARGVTCQLEAERTSKEENASGDVQIQMISTSTMEVNAPVRR